MSDNAAGRNLSQIAVYFGAGPETNPIPNQVLKDMIAALSELAGQSPPWSHSYLRLILNGKSEPGQRLGQAIDFLGAIIDGTPPAAAMKERVEVLADPDQVRTGTIIVGLWSAKCNGPECPVRILTDGRRHYCSRTCSNRAAYWRRKGRTWPTW